MLSNYDFCSHMCNTNLQEQTKTAAESLGQVPKVAIIFKPLSVDASQSPAYNNPVSMLVAEREAEGTFSCLFSILTVRRGREWDRSTEKLSRFNVIKTILTNIDWNQLKRQKTF